MIITIMMKVIITFAFCCRSLWKSNFMALEKPGKFREFFILLCGHRELLFELVERQMDRQSSHRYQ